MGGGVNSKLAKLAEVKCLEALCLYHGRQKQPEDVLVFADQLLQLRKSDVGYRSRGFALMMLQQYQEAGFFYRNWADESGGETSQVELNHAFFVK